jgi:DNA-binding beta-propeller fold protein YncE
MTFFSGHVRRATLGLLVAGSMLAGVATVHAQSTFSTLDRSSEARVNFSASERGKPIVAGSEVAIAGQGFKPGQQVTLLYGATPISGGALTADAEGKIAGKFTVPANAIAGTHPIVVVAQGPYTAKVADLKVSPNIPLSGQADYQVIEGQAARGLYQSAYSAKSNALFVASAVGRPPVRQSELVKLNPDTLKVIARISPASAPEQARPAGAPPPPPPGAGPRGGAAEGPQGPGLYAVYGLAVDDVNGTVWATNTRQNTASVYRQSDLSLVKQFAPDTVGHPRDVRVDAALGKAYVSPVGKPEIVVFDTAKLEVAKTIPVKALGRGKEFSPASLSLDAANHRLYVVSLSTNEVAVINTQTDTVEKVLPVPGAIGAIGVSHDPQTGRIFVASQGSDNVIVLDGKDGRVIADTPTGAGALNVVFDPVKRRAYVSNRGASTIAVVDADGKLLANLGPAPLANHVSLGKDGTVFAVDKSASVDGDEGDTVLRIRPKK